MGAVVFVFLTPLYQFYFLQYAFNSKKEADYVSKEVLPSR